MILLPPSETKAPGGEGAPLDLESLSFPELTNTRRELIDRLTALDGEAALKTLGLSARMANEVAANQELERSATMPAALRYTGVLFDALDAATLPADARGRLAVGSALFGLLRGADQIPRYRLSAGTKLGGATLKGFWGRQITEALEGVDSLVVDLRSGAYQALGRLSGAVTVRVETPEGKVVSHFNKRYKGELARALALHSGEPADAEAVAGIAADSGLDAAVSGGQVVLTVQR